MKITNKLELPELMYRALSGGISPEVGEMDFNVEIGKISVTTLVSPPRMVILRARHSDEIEEDVSDRMWLLMGNGMHYAFEKVRMPNVMQETRLKVVRMVEDQQSVSVRWELQGRADVAIVDERANRILIDWKTGSVYGYKFRRDNEDEPQLNIYALMMWNIWRLEFDHLRVWLIMRDWMQSKRGEFNYPNAPFAEFEVKRWGIAETEAWIDSRLKVLMENVKLADDDPALVECTPEETWERDPSFVVMKEGRKTALRVLDTEAAAEAWIAGSVKPGEKISIVRRPGTRSRCENYCKAAPWCAQYKNFLDNQKVVEG